MNASSALISVVEFDIPTGNNKFDLKIFMIFIIDKAKLTKVFNFSKRILKKILKKEKNNVTN